MNTFAVSPDSVFTFTGTRSAGEGDQSNRAQVPALLDWVVAEIPEQCEGERCLRLMLTVVREGFFDVIDEVNPSVA